MYFVAKSKLEFPGNLLKSNSDFYFFNRKRQPHLPQQQQKIDSVMTNELLLTSYI